MTESDAQILREFASRVRGQFPEAQVRAFGSRVCGNADQESDLDVCVVLSSFDEAADKKIIDIAWEVGFAHDVLISTVTFSAEEFTESPLSQSPLVQAIRRDGVAA